MKIKNMKVISICCFILLLLALAPMPIGYYTFLRIAVTLCAITICIVEYRNNINSWLLLFGFTAILFNPVFPVYLYYKMKWMPIDIGVAILFITYVFKFKANKNV